MSSFGTKGWSEVRSEVCNPHFKVRFRPGDRVLYCDRRSLSTLIHRRKELAWRDSNAIKSEPEPDYGNPPYAVGFPGKYDDLGITKDPRLGAAERKRSYIFAKRGIDVDDYSVSHDKSDNEESDDDTEKSEGDTDESEYDSDESEGEEGLEHITIDPNMVPKIKTRYIDPLRKSDFKRKRKANIPNEEEKAEKRARQLHEKKEAAKSLRDRYNNAVVNEAQHLKYRDCKCAHLAMKFYNDKHATDFVIVETLGSYCRIYDGVWFHCNFRACRKSDGDHERHAKPVLFFAEIYRRVANAMVVNDCKMLNDPGHRPNIVRGCKLCGDLLWHPVNGFEKGK